ncbi:MAG: ZIP family metal transporter [Cyclobacteriaceae bacterium]|nr:ZIP family metal transporter [Cyclobacteriaceae bacterium]MCH8515073.1 ZIP family metal transporter [Cyclobacteriaceae bacterium]
MIIQAAILFFTAFLAGYAYTLFPNLSVSRFRYTLVFAGSFLFSITIIHILPEVMTGNLNPHYAGLWVLAGFFLQLVLEYWSKGIEHGHMHVHPEKDGSSISYLSLLLGLFLHALLEGSLLSHPGSHGHDHGQGHLLWGIVLHKMPAAFALVAVMSAANLPKVKIWSYLFIFAIASPIGLLASDYLQHTQLLGSTTMDVLFALVCGNFLHISTTIFIESNPDHSLRRGKFLIALLGAGIAIASEFLI